MTNKILIFLLLFSLKFNAQVQYTNTTNTGNYATAIGESTVASVDKAVAMGGYTDATGGFSTAMGRDSQATGNSSTAMGEWAVAAGHRSTAIGYRVTASDYASLVIGSWNLSGSSVTTNGSASNYDSDNTAFVIGNGTATNLKSDAFKVMFNGDTYVSNTLYLGGLAITSTAAELNLLDGLTAIASSTNGLSDALVEDNSIYVGNNPSSTTDTAEYNVAIGTTALDAITIGDKNVAVGYDALTANTTGSNNTVVGYQALNDNVSGNQNGAFGYGALYNNTSGTLNNAFGHEALFTNETGQYNSAFGHEALKSNTGSNNTAFGMRALKPNTSGSNNTALGYFAKASASNATNQTVLGYTAEGQADNSVTLGNADVTAVYMGQDSGATVYAGEGSFTGDMTIGGDDLTIGDLSAFSGSFTQRSAIDVVAHSDGDLMTGYINGSTGDRFNIELDAGNSLAKISSGGGYDLTFSTEGGTMNFESNGFETGTYAFNGNTTVSNDLTVSGDVVVSSDARLKANIVSLGSTLAKLILIDGKTYTMKKDGKQKIGVLAQDIQKVFPELVSEGDNEMLAVNYQGLVPVLINALKEQQAEINKLKEQEQRLEKLEKLIYQMKK